MSGICGLVLRDKDCAVAPSLGSMLRALRPLEGRKDHAAQHGPIGLGACGSPGRLAGVAEMTLHGRPLRLAFYGNLYNLEEISAFAGNRKEPFQGILELYIKEGMDFLKRLRGEFALAVWDGSTESLWLATDRFRVHPVFYYHDGSKFVFASRMRVILACLCPQSWNINPQAVVDVVSASMVPTPRTIFQGVHKLPPGYVLAYSHGEITLNPYWEINFRVPSGAPEPELARNLQKSFADSISVRLAGDQPWDRIGTFLSGGVDSSTLTGVLTHLSGRPIKCFSIGFDQEKFNEINYARIAAQAFDAQHHEYFVTPGDVCEALPILLQSFDEPFANASAVPTYFCAKLAKEHGVDILYAGDGGDELFAGNQRYADQRLFDYYYKIPGVLRAVLVKPIVFALADALAIPFFHRAKKYIQRATIPYPQRLTSYGFFHVFPLRDLLTTEFLESVGRQYDPDALAHGYYDGALANTPLDRQLYLDLKMTISDNDVLKVIRMTEAAGVTARFPFLDHLLAEFAASIPSTIKMRGRRLRSFFKKAYADLVPVEVRTKRKHGFGLPIPIWLRTDKRLNDLMYEMTLSPRSIQRGYFRKTALENIIDRHKNDETSFYGTFLWNVIVLELWHRNYVDCSTINTSIGTLSSMNVSAVRSV
jgi:asparagine synthase (glutamine-hydrolysing)